MSNPSKAKPPQKTKRPQFERGFKTWSENIAVSLRDNLGVKRNAPLDLLGTARHLNISVLDFHKLPMDEATKNHLCCDGNEEWSAITVQMGEVDAVVINPCHSLARKVSDLAHEISHLLRGHQPAQVIINPALQISLRTYNTVQEDEAGWLSGCLLLPRLALLHVQTCGWENERICEHYRVSPQMLRYRLNVTGLAKRARSAA